MNTCTIQFAALVSPFQAAVCRDLQELRRLGTLRRADYQRAVKIVRKNEGNIYSEHSCMSVTEAADLAADMARLAGNGSTNR